MKKASYSSKTPKEKEYTPSTPSFKGKYPKQTPEEKEFGLFSASASVVNEKMTKEKKQEEKQDVLWGDPAKVFNPASKKNTKPAATVKKMSDKVPVNIKELVLLIKDLSDNLESKDQSILKSLRKRSEKVTKAYGLS